MSLLNVNKVDPATGTALELGTSGDTITVPSGATFNVAGTLQTGGSDLVTGKILQVATNAVADTAQASISSGSWEAVGSISVALSALASTSSKVNVSASCHYDMGGNDRGFGLNIYRDIAGGGYAQIRALNDYRISSSSYTEQQRLGFWSYSTTFSPSTTGVVTFKLYGITGATAYIDMKTLDLTAMEIGA